MLRAKPRGRLPAPKRFALGLTTRQFLPVKGCQGGSFGPEWPGPETPDFRTLDS